MSLKVVEEKEFPYIKLCFVKGHKWEWGKPMKEILSKLAWDNKEAVVERNQSCDGHNAFVKCPVTQTTATVAAVNKIIAVTFLKPLMVYTSLACMLSAWPCDK